MRRLRCRYPYESWECSCCGTRVDDAPPSAALRGLCCERCLDRGLVGEPFIPLTVRSVPPIRRPEDRPIVAASMRQERCALENGETFGLEGLVDRIRERRNGETGWHDLPDRLPRSIILVDNSIDLLGYLNNSRCASSPFWQWRVSLRDRTAWRPEASRRCTHSFITMKPVQFGYAKAVRQNGVLRRRKGNTGLFHLMICPSMFCELPGGWPELELRDLITFGRELRDWTNHARLPLLASVSAYGARLLKDGRFDDRSWRRKVPAATNRRLRRRLPGNHYQLLTRPGLTHLTVHKFDQDLAHHHAALTNRFPHADQLDARGHYRTDPPRNGTPAHGPGAIRTGSSEWSELLTHAGLFHIAITVPQRLLGDPLQLPQLRTPGATWQTLTSVEVEHARRIPGVRLGDIHTCWTSPDDDDRPREYAWWAGQELQAAAGESRRAWLKPLLLAPYGMLAVRPGRFRSAWRSCSRPDGMVGFTTRYGELVGYERGTGRPVEPATVNVLWRAIIETSVRLESLRFARELQEQQMRPISIYADAVFATGSPPERLRPPWRHDGIVHHLTFETPGRYRSQEETRLPGTPHRTPKPKLINQTTAIGGG